MYSSRRVILEDPGRLADIEALGRMSGWGVVHDEDRPPESGTARSIQWNLPDGAVLDYFENTYADCAYLRASAADKDETYRIALEMERRFDGLSSQELLVALDQAADDVEELGFAIIRAGLGAPNYLDQEFFDRMVPYFTHENSEIRAAAVFSTIYMQWTRFKPYLEELAASDPDETVRHDAAQYLPYLTKGESEDEDW